MIRIAIVFVRNRVGDYFVHRRRPEKRVFPNRYGIGAGGRIEPDETPVVGAARELTEETGLTVPIEHVCDFPFESGGVHYTVHFYFAQADGPIPNHDAEWSDSGFRKEAEVRALIASGQMCPDTAECFRRLMKREGAAGG